jgi:hypothetical protein
VNCMKKKKKSYRYHPHVVPCMRINKSHDNSLVGVRLHINTAHQITWVDTADEDDREALSLPRPIDWQNGNVEMKTVYNRSTIETTPEVSQPAASKRCLQLRCCNRFDRCNERRGYCPVTVILPLFIYAIPIFAWLQDQEKHSHQ